MWGAMKKLDLTKRSHQIIVGTMASMVEDEGLTPREVFEVLEDIKNQTWPALSEIYHERKQPLDHLTD